MIASKISFVRRCRLEEMNLTYKRYEAFNRNQARIGVLSDFFFKLIYWRNHKMLWDLFPQVLEIIGLNITNFPLRLL